MNNKGGNMERGTKVNNFKVVQSQIQKLSIGCHQSLIMILIT